MSEKNEKEKELKSLGADYYLESWIVEWKLGKVWDALLVDERNDMELWPLALFDCLWTNYQKYKDHSKVYSVVSSLYNIDHLNDNMFRKKYIVVPMKTVAQYGLCIIMNPGSLLVSYLQVVG